MAKVTVHFQQKVSEQPYETADYSLMIETEVPEGHDPIAVGNDLFAQVKSEVLKQAGCEYDLTQDGLVMRRLETGVRTNPRPQASAPAAPPVGGPTASSAAVSATAAPAAPPAPPAGAGGRMSGRVMPRTEFAVGKDADKKQAAFNILAFHPAKWSDGSEAYKVKEKADGTTDTTQKGTNYPNFSVTAAAMGMAGIHVERDMGVWINAGDSNVPLKVWDVLSGETQDMAREWDWAARRAELQQFAYQGR